MININKYFNSIINKSPKSIKNGDIVKFSIVRKLDNDKAIVNIMGNKIIAIFKDKIIEKGFALVSKENNKLILTILKNVNSVKEAKENIKNGISVNISSAGKENSQIANLLLSNSYPSKIFPFCERYCRCWNSTLNSLSFNAFCRVINAKRRCLP